MKIIGPDDPSRVGLLDITDMFTIASGPGLVSFEWAYSTLDFFGNQIFDAFFQLLIMDLDGSFSTTELSDPFGGAEHGGQCRLSV